MQAYGSSLTSLIKGLDLSPMFGPTQEISRRGWTCLATRSRAGFQVGQPGLARELMFGHMATEYKDAIVAIQSVKYSALLRRPIWNIRFGISMAVRGDDAVDPKPIRESANSSRLMANNGRGGPTVVVLRITDLKWMTSDMEREHGRCKRMDMQMDMEMDMERGRGPGGTSGRGGPTARRASASDDADQEHA